jgi:hypothetical protein
MITKQEAADYINANINTTLTVEEINTIKSSINKNLAVVLIKLLGDVTMLVEIRDGE